MDRFDLDRFRVAQAGVFATAQAELRAGAKRSHWMWFIFPQMRGLGTSPTAQLYGIGSRAEAEAYLGDATLGPRLQDMFEIVFAQAGSAREIFGAPDDLKFLSCATLFANLEAAPPVFAAAIARFFGGRPDPRTLDLLRRPPLISCRPRAPLVEIQAGRFSSVGRATDL